MWWTLTTAAYHLEHDPERDRAAPNIVVGEQTFSSTSGGNSASGLNFPGAVYSDGTKLYVADTGISRVVIWNTIPTVNGASANVVVGQPNMTSFASGLSASSFGTGVNAIYTSATNELYVADASNNRVLVWNTIPSANGAAASSGYGAAEHDVRHRQ